MLFLFIFLIVPNSSHAEDSHTTLPDNKIEDDLASPPRLIYRVEPVYPRKAEEYNLSGTVLIKIMITKDGSIKTISLASSSGYELLDNAALTAVKQWRFIPAKEKNGQSVDSIVLMPIRFVLEEAPYTTIKSVIDSWNPDEVNIYRYPDVYNLPIEQINAVVRKFDVNQFDKSLNQLIDAIASIDLAEKYDRTVYCAVARKMVKKLYPEHDSAAQLAKRAAENGYKCNFKEAISYYDKAIALEPYDSDYYGKRGLDYFLLKDNLNAIRDFTKAIELDPTNYKFYNMRGFNYFILKNDQKSEENFNKAIELNPEVADNYKDRGELYYRQKEYQKAIDDYNRAIAIESDDYWYYIERGQIYRDMKKYREALNDYNRAFEIAPNMLVPDLEHYARGEIYLFLNDYTNAFSDFDKAVKLSPNTAVYYNGRGKALCGLEKYQQAIDDYSKAIEKCANNTKQKKLEAACFLNRAMAYEKMGQAKEAARDIQKADDLNSSKNSVDEEK